MLDENSFMIEINEVFRNLQLGKVEKVSSITISFPQTKMERLVNLLLLQAAAMIISSTLP